MVSLRCLWAIISSISKSLRLINLNLDNPRLCCARDSVAGDPSIIFPGEWLIVCWSNLNKQRTRWNEVVHPSTKKIDKKPREASINTVQLISAHFTRDISETQIFTRSRVPLSMLWREEEILAVVENYNAISIPMQLPLFEWTRTFSSLFCGFVSRALF